MATSDIIGDVIFMAKGIRRVRKALRKAHDALVAVDLASARVGLREADQEALDALGRLSLDEEDMVGLDGGVVVPTGCGRLKPRRTPG